LTLLNSPNLNFLNPSPEHDDLLAKYDPKVLEVDRFARRNAEMASEVSQLEAGRAELRTRVAVLQEQVRCSDVVKCVDHV
jgi:hypothetical protein